MANDVIVTDELVNHYVNVVIPNLEERMASADLKDEEKVQLYKLYKDLLLITAPHNFISYNKYLEIDEDARQTNKKFYWHRRFALQDVFNSLNDMEINDTYDMLLISCPPRVGKTTIGIRFLSWIMGRHPENTQLGTSYSDSITTSFYIGTMEVVQSDKFKEIFPHSPLINQNAKREEIWLKKARRYPTISYVPINGSMTGRAEAEHYLYCDDLVSGIEEAMSPVRLEKLWQTYSVNARQRKKDGCKEIHIATRWSVHDPITRLENTNEDNPRCKTIKISCYDDKGDSNFDFFGGFSTEYYKDQENTMDELSFNAIYKQEPIEREGILYNKEDLSYYFQLPSEVPDTIIAVCDSKNMGSDSVCNLIGYVYGEHIYVEDVVFNNGLPDVTRPLVANKLAEHKVVRCDVELNNGGNYYAEDLQEMLKQKGCKTSIRMFFSSNNKQVKIVTYSDFVKSNIFFKHSSTYAPKSEYGKFMKELCSYTQTGKNPHDDAPDGVAMLAQMFQDLSGMSIKVLDRRKLGL